MITGLRPETFENLQLNAGVFLKDFDLDTPSDKDTLEDAILAALESGEGVMGATRGGGSFRAVPTTRSIEADGKRFEFKGSLMIDTWDIRLTGTLLEITPENMKDSLMCADLTTEGNKTILRIRNSIKDKDYILKVCWVGDTSRGLVAIELTNALNTAGANFTFTDKGEGTLPFEFVAHQASLTDSEFAPVRVIFFDEADTTTNTTETEEQEEGA